MKKKTFAPSSHCSSRAAKYCAHRMKKIKSLIQKYSNRAAGSRKACALVLAMASFLTPAFGQTVSIPDPGLNAAIRAALAKPTGPLTAPDLLSLTNLQARNRDISSLQGLEGARNLVSLDLTGNRLTNFTLLTPLTNLVVLDLSANPLIGFAFPNGETKLDFLNLEGAGL